MAKSKRDNEELQVSDEMFEFLQQKAEDLKNGKLNLIGPLSPEDFDKLVDPEIKNSTKSKE